MSEWLLPFWREGQGGRGQEAGSHKRSLPWLVALSVGLLVSVQKGGELGHGSVLPALAGCRTAQPGANWSCLSCL